MTAECQISRSILQSPLGLFQELLTPFTIVRCRLNTSRADRPRKHDKVKPVRGLWVAHLVFEVQQRSQSLSIVGVRD